MEIPVIHEISLTSQPRRSVATRTSVTGRRMMTSAPSPAPLSPTSSTNDFLRLSKLPPPRHLTSASRGVNSTNSNGKPHTSHPVTRSEGNHCMTSSLTSDYSNPSSSSLLHSPSSLSSSSSQRGVHSRLPSTDSGISTDGFDSLSRYRGKNFLSTSIHGDLTPEDPQAPDSPFSTWSDLSFYSSLPRHKCSSPLTVSISSPRHATYSSPRASLNLERSNSPRSSLQLERTFSPLERNISPRSSLVLERTISPSSSRPLSPSDTAASSSPRVSSPLSWSSGPPSTSKRPSSINSRVTINPSCESTGVRVTQRPGGVRVSIEDGSTSRRGSRITISQKHESRPDCAPPPIPTSKRSYQPETYSAKISSQPAHIKTTPISVTATPGSTLRLRVGGDSSNVSANDDTFKTSNPGNVLLTRPLKVSSLNKSNDIDANNSSPSGVVDSPSVRSYDSVHHASEPKPSQNPKPPITRPKPQTLPRTVFTPQSAKTKTSSFSNANNSSPKVKTFSEKPAVLSKTFSSADARISVKSPERSEHTAAQPRRTEIPVKHIDSCTASLRSPAFGRRVSPHDRVFKKMSPIDQIYEDVKMLRDSFKFDDEDAKLKHTDLILRQSNDLIQDALQLFGNPRLETKIDVNSGSCVSKPPLGERIVEGSDAEVVVPLLDRRKDVVGGGKPEVVRADVKGQNGKGQSPEMSQPCGSWEERKDRMDSALLWLKQELADLRAMDSDLISQFQRCQDTIETLKTQREFWDCLCEEDESEYWEDFEINEFNRRYLDSPGGSSSSQLSPGSRDTSLPDMTSVVGSGDSLRKESSPWRDITARLGSPRREESPRIDGVIKRKGSPKKEVPPWKEISARLSSPKKESSPCQDVEATV